MGARELRQGDDRERLGLGAGDGDPQPRNDSMTSRPHPVSTPRGVTGRRGCRASAYLDARLPTKSRCGSRCPAASRRDPLGPCSLAGAERWFPEPRWIRSRCRPSWWVQDPVAVLAHAAAEPEVTVVPDRSLDVRHRKAVGGVGVPPDSLVVTSESGSTYEPTVSFGLPVLPSSAQLATRPGSGP